MCIRDRCRTVARCSALGPRSRRYIDYSKSALNDAIKEVKTEQLSIRKAAEKYSVDRSILNRKLMGCLLYTSIMKYYYLTPTRVYMHV